MPNNGTHAANARPNFWKKGRTGNPLGSSARGRELGAIKRLTVEEVAEIGSLILANNYEALRAIRNDRDASVLKIWLATLILRSMARGEVQVFEAILDRVIGKAPAQGYTRAMQQAEAEERPAMPW